MRTAYGKRTRPTNDAATAYERSYTWLKVSRTFRNCNSVCQVIDEGVRCCSKSELVHHLVSPAVDFELRQDWKNLVAICKRHHSKEAGDAGKFDYCPTKLLDGTWFTHPPRATKLFNSHGPSAAKVEELLADVQNVDPDELLTSL